MNRQSYSIRHAQRGEVKLKSIVYTAVLNIGVFVAFKTTPVGPAFSVTLLNCWVLAVDAFAIAVRLTPFNVTADVPGRTFAAPLAAEKFSTRPPLTVVGPV